MKNILLLILLSALLAACSNTKGEDNLEDAQQLVIDTTKFMIYADSDINIGFPGSFLEVEHKYFKANINKSYTEGYFLSFEKSILFHEDDQVYFYHNEESGEMIPLQAAICDNGYLSTLYIYPSIDETSLLSEIEMAFNPDSLPMKYSGVKSLTINNLNLINWRLTHLKNRFEYYLLLGKTKNYLFISTPYGEKEYIENLLQNIKFVE